ncbi:hypothetical protein IW262DRAFT_1295314 [Armillaria fumosa]|nr:hypothetical protein IW262DRAFT_1295314 [Armillaria fumosa]
MPLFIPSSAKTNAPPSRHLKVGSGRLVNLTALGSHRPVPDLFLIGGQASKYPPSFQPHVDAFLVMGSGLTRSRLWGYPHRRHVVSCITAQGCYRWDSSFAVPGWRHSLERAKLYPTFRRRYPYMNRRVSALSGYQRVSPAPAGPYRFSQGANSRRSYHFWIATIFDMGLIFPLELSVIKKLQATFDGRRRKIGRCGTTTTASGYLPFHGAAPRFNHNLQELLFTSSADPSDERESVADWTLVGHGNAGTGEPWVSVDNLGARLSANGRSFVKGGIRDIIEVMRRPAGGNGWGISIWDEALLQGKDHVRPRPKIRDDRRQVATPVGVKYTYTAKVSKSPQRKHDLDLNLIRGQSSLIAAGLWSDSLPGTLIRGRILFLFESLKYPMKRE